MSSDADAERNAPEGIVQDDSYTTDDNDVIPVVSDNAEVEEGYKSGQADTDTQLGKHHLAITIMDWIHDSHKLSERDEADAINESNIIKERTRHARPQGTYKEPSDEQGLEWSWIETWLVAHP